MDHAEMSKHIRQRIAKSGIAARVWTRVVCGERWVQVLPSAFDVDFTADECKTIKTIAKVNGLTHVQGVEVDENLYTCREMVFVYHC